MKYPPWLEEWDAELTAIERELQRQHAILDDEHRRMRLTPLVARQVRVVQATLDAERALGRIAKLAAKETILPAREQALLHGARNYLDAARLLLPARTQHMARAFWAGLVRARLTRPSSENVAADRNDDAEDLVALAVRQANLSKTERHLENDLIVSRKHKLELTARYRVVEIALANKDAGGTFGASLGATPEEAAEGPYARALEACLRALLPRGGFTAAGLSTTTKAEAASTRREGGLLAQCRRLVLRGLRDPKTTAPVGTSPVSDKALARFKSALRQLDDHREAPWPEEPLPPARPIVVKAAPSGQRGS